MINEDAHGRLRGTQCQGSAPGGPEFLERTGGHTALHPDSLLASAARKPLPSAPHLIILPSTILAAL